MGAPLKYKIEHCKKARDILGAGKSLASVCAHFGISRSTLYVWRDTQPEFKDAIDSGLQKAQAYWEDIGHDGITGEFDKFGAAPWIFTMKNRFREDYAEDKKEQSNVDTIVDKLIDKLVE